MDALINKYAGAYGVDPALVRAVMRNESGFNSGAVSPKGAQGLMQLMPGTAAQMGVRDPFDPEQNIAGGVGYLRHCLDRFGHNVPLAVAAYNAGPEAVAKYCTVPPYQETQALRQQRPGNLWLQWRQASLEQPRPPSLGSRRPKNPPGPRRPRRAGHAAAAPEQDKTGPPPPQGQDHRSPVQ